MQKQCPLAIFCQLATLYLIHEIQFIFAENESDGCSSQYFFKTNEIIVIVKNIIAIVLKRTPECFH